MTSIKLNNSPLNVYCFLQFHQTLKTFLRDRVWEFYFYVTKTWPEQTVILHFPGMTKTVRYLNIVIIIENNVAVNTFCWYMWTRPHFLVFFVFTLILCYRFIIEIPIIISLMKNPFYVQRFERNAYCIVIMSKLIKWNISNYLHYSNKIYWESRI